MTRPPIKPTARLLKAYRATTYAAAGATTRVGARSPAIDGILKTWRTRQAVFLGADNPASRRMPPGWNRRMAQALQSWLRHIPNVPGAGQGRGWIEAHRLAALPPPRAIVLARRFRQTAIVLLTVSRPARLLILPQRPQLPRLAPPRRRRPP